MIKIGSDIAKWEKHIALNDGEQLNSKTNGVEFRAWEVELKRRSQTDLIPGTTSTVNQCDLAIRTSDNAISEISSDDTVYWKNYGYSVITAQDIRTNLGLYSKDYIIYLKR